MAEIADILLENLKAVASGITETFGRNCEVVVHDFKNLDHSLVYVAGNITGRKPGAPITDLVLRVLKEEGDNAKDLIDYKNILHDGRMLKSSTIFVRDHIGKIIGAFCINYDLTDIMSACSVVNDLARVGKSQENKGEYFATSIQETIERLVGEAIEAYGKQPATMQTKDKIKVVSYLEGKGTFLIKGALDYVAIVLGVSKFTVYNYLQKVRSINELVNAHYTEGETETDGDNSQ